MKVGWKEISLEDACEMYQPKTITSNDLIENGEFPVYGANGVIGRYNQYNHEHSQLIITCRGATCGAVNVSQPKSWITGNAMVVRPKIDNLSIKFLEYLFRGQINLTKAITGAAQPQITRQSLNPIVIPLPPLAEQHRIVDILDRAASIQRLRTEADAKLRELIPALFVDMFGDPVTNPKGWPTIPLDDLCEEITTWNIKKDPRSSFRYIDIGSIDREKGIISNSSIIAADEAPSRAKQIVRVGDILISAVRPNLRGTAYVSQEFDDQICSTGFCVLRPSNRINSEYLYYIARSDWFVSLLTSKVRGASYPAVSDRDIFEITIPVPNVEQQRKFSDRVSFAQSVSTSGYRSFDLDNGLQRSLSDMFFR